jgi:hypothetical protein
MPRRLTMQRGNSGLQCEWPRPASQSLFYKWKGFVNLLAIPSRTILVFEEDEFSGFIETRISA